MKIPVEKRLFWYLRNGTEFDLKNPSHVDMYIQQVLSYGRADDIKKLLKILPLEVFKKSFERIKIYLPKEVRMFWEDGLGSSRKHPKKNPKLT